MMIVRLQLLDPVIGYHAIDQLGSQPQIAQGIIRPQIVSKS